ncbi:MAG: hypothetical protein CMH54_08525 [Myxococcales bacterium]|nr:hypothetical protein [Myxococcales bacterium]
MAEPLWTVQQAADWLNISERTAYQMARDDALAGAIKIGGSWRVDPQRLQDWVSGRVAASGTGLTRQVYDATAPVETARTPPSSWYRSAVRDQQERRAVLAANWQVVAHGDELIEPGSYLAGCTASEPWLLVRDEEGGLRAFSNVCRHNGTPVAEGRGKAEQFVCPYHGWRYHLDGRLSKAPRLGGIKDFNREEFGLRPLQVQQFGPLILLNISGDCSPLDLSVLTTQLDASGWDKLKRVERRSYHLKCNWKVFIDNYLDGGYHVPSLHQDLAADLDLQSYRTELFERYSIQTVGATTGSSARIGDAIYAWVYPNLMINRYGPMMDVNVVVPTGAETCRVDFDWYFEPGSDASFIAESIVASEQVQDEDIAVCNALQEGMRSMHFRPGPYAPRVEQGKHHFHGLIASDLP